jgi:hypothetical protein
VAAGAALPSQWRKLLRGIYHQFLWPESCPVSSHTNQELSPEARLETVPSGVRPTGRFDPCADAVTPEGFGCYCADQNAIVIPGGTTPPKGPARQERGAQWNHECGERADLGKVRQPSSNGAACKSTSPRCKSERNLRVKRRDPWLWANVSSKAAADPELSGEDADKQS